MDVLLTETVRAYDIRGLAPEEIGVEQAAWVGRGFAAWLEAVGASSVGGDGRGGLVVGVGHDARGTSGMLYEAVIEGLTGAGVGVVGLGLCPTPVVGWAVDRLGLGGGLVVTASHNPPEYNGFKLLGPGAVPLLSEEIAAVARGGGGSGARGARGGGGSGAREAWGDSGGSGAREAWGDSGGSGAGGARGSSASSGARGARSDSGGSGAREGRGSSASSGGRGGGVSSFARGRRWERDVAGDYLGMLAGRFARTGLRVAVDPGNGVVSRTGPAALAAVAEGVHAIHHTVMARGAHVADPQEPSTMVDLARAVTTLGLDLGIAWDADGDRIGVVDHRGYRYEADWLAALLARGLLERRPGAAVLLDAKASRSAVEDVRAHGGDARVAPTGYPLFRRRMRAEGIAFGGETSGHIMFGPEYLGGEHYPWLDDGVYAACALVGWLERSGQSLAEAASSIRVRPASPELRLPCADEEKAGVAAAIGDFHAKRLGAGAVERSDGARIDYGDGWAHARPSNTAPVLSLRFEADTEEAYERIGELLLASLEGHPGVGGREQIGAAALMGPQPPG